MLRTDNDVLLEAQIRDIREELRAAIDRVAPPVKCAGFGTEGPPCMSCPNNEHCPIVQPETRVTLYLHKLRGDGAGA